MARDAFGEVPGAAVEIGAIILAAGFGRRFGSDKRLALLDGKPVAQTTVETYASVFSKVRVVLRREDSELARRLAGTAELTFTDSAHLGMGHSLAAGAQNLAWNWAFVGLADMPYVQPQTLRRLIQAAIASKQTILRPKIKPRLPQQQQLPPHGHPIGFRQMLFPELAALTGDQGAREIVRARQNEIEEIELEDLGIIRDIDQRTDLPT